MRRNMDVYLTYAFVLSVCGLFAAFAAELILDPWGTQRYIFLFGLNSGWLCDFLYLLPTIAGRDPYFATTYFYANYFPLSYVILYPFSQLDNFAAMSVQDIYLSKMGLMSCFVFTGFSVFLLFTALNQIIKKYSVPHIVLVSLALNCVFIYTISGANLVILSTACVCYFICNYDSENKHKRIYAAIALALAVTLKVYPAVFGILYLARKQWRETFFCAIITLVLVFVPYLFFKHGFANIPQHIHILRTKFHWMAQSTSIYPRFSLSNLLYCISLILEFPEKTILSLLSAAKAVNVTACIVALIFSYLEENKWLKISMLTMVLLFMPSSSGFYCGLYVFPMIILFFSTMRERTKIFNIFTLMVFIAFLNPFQVGVIRTNMDVGGFFGANYLIVNFCTLSLYLVLLISSGKRITMKYFAKKLLKK